MKIGVMTQWTSVDNYGQQLQIYALQKYLKQLGHEAFLIRYGSTYDCKKITGERIVSKFKNSYKIFYPGYFRDKYLNKNKRNRERDISIQLRKFDEFQRKFLSVSDLFYGGYSEITSNPPEADAYITGSDQVWNFPEIYGYESESYIRAYMLDFGDKKIKRIAAAASWGKTVISDDMCAFLKPLFEQFDAVTVREKSGLELCRQCGRDATVVLDPTLYLQADSYRNIYKDCEIKKPRNLYIMVYWVNNGGHPPMNEIAEWAKQRGLSIEYVTANGMIDPYPKNYATIPEWLCLIDHAEYVITNSFHGAVFALLFNKKFGVIQIQGLEKGMNSRIDSLFENCNVTPRYIEDNSFEVLDKQLERIRIDERLKLKEAISGDVKL